MVATVLSGKDCSTEIRADLKRKVGWWPPGTDCSWSPQVEEIKNNDPHFKPGLVIVQVKTSLGSFGANPVTSGSLYTCYLRWEGGKTQMSISG